MKIVKDPTIHPELGNRTVTVWWEGTMSDDEALDELAGIIAREIHRKREKERKEKLELEKARLVKERSENK